MSDAAIASMLSSIAEVADHSTRFAEVSKTTTPDGRGGIFTAVIAERHPSADGKGQILAFWDGAKFIGLAQDFEVYALGTVEPAGTGAIVATYVNYRTGDPLCCPTGSPRLYPIHYSWNGDRVVPDKPLLPGMYGTKALVVVPPRN